MSGFLQALPVTLQFEGGYSDHPDDPGGATMRGVTQKVYDQWRSAQGLPTRPVRGIDEEEVEAIYHRDYWLAGKCDALPWPVSMTHFDACVNHGRTNAAKMLQRAVGADDDGVIGPRTLAAVSAIPVEILAVRMLWERLAFYERIMRRNSRLRTFALGWLSRVNVLHDRVRAALPEAA